VPGAPQSHCGGHTLPAASVRLWRVSTTNQLGMASAASESCSRENAPWSARLSDSQLAYEIADSRIQDIGLCEAHMGGLSCVVQISIVDTVLLQHFSVRLRLEVRRGAALALAITTTETYIPLASLRVEAQHAYRDTDESPVLVVVSDMAARQAAARDITDVLLFGSGLVPVQPAADMNCARYAVGDVGNVSADAWALQTEHVRTTTFLRAPHGTVFIKLFYTLRLREREPTAVKNTMHIAVWRNLSLTSPRRTPAARRNSHPERQRAAGGGAHHPCSAQETLGCPKGHSAGGSVREYVYVCSPAYSRSMYVAGVHIHGVHQAVFVEYATHKKCKKKKCTHNTKQKMHTKHTKNAKNAHTTNSFLNTQKMKKKITQQIQENAKKCTQKTQKTNIKCKTKCKNGGS